MITTGTAIAVGAAALIMIVLGTMAATGANLGPLDTTASTKPLLVTMLILLAASAALCWQTMLGGLAAISLFVAAIGIANTMVMSIYERTKEIGVMKVLGAELGAIRAMFLTESAMIGLIGGVVGVGLSFLISYLLNNVPIVANLLASLGLSFGNGGAVSIIPWWLVLVAMVFSMMVGVVFGFIPANRAVKISALEAIRHD